MSNDEKIEFLLLAVRTLATVNSSLINEIQYLRTFSGYSCDQLLLQEQNSDVVSLLNKFLKTFENDKDLDEDYEMCKWVIEKAKKLKGDADNVAG